MGIGVQRSRRGDMADDDGQGLYIHPVFQRHRGKSMPIGYNKDKSGIALFARVSGFVLVLFPLKTPQFQGL